MTELEQYVTDRGADAVAAWLRALPEAAGFNMLWKAPSQLLPLFAHFRLETIGEFLDFAAGLQNGGTWTERRDELSHWINPRPGVLLEDMERVDWLVVERILVEGQIPTHAIYWVQPNDAVVYLPTVEQLRTIMARCPANRFPVKPNDLDCDDHTRILRGWLSEHGLGPAAIGWGGYRVYDSAGNDIGAHALGLAVCQDRQIWLAEPRDGKVYAKNTVGLGGFIFASRVEFQRAIF